MRGVRLVHVWFHAVWRWAVMDGLIQFCSCFVLLIGIDALVRMFRRVISL